MKKDITYIAKVVLSILKKFDYETYKHSLRVANLGVNIARGLEIESVSVEDIYIGGLLHDIGKVTVPVAVLNKEGSLSNKEWRKIKAHPWGGYKMLKSIDKEMFKDNIHIAEMVLQHHERNDGSGYPLGLVKSEISLGAKILAVADVVDAMSSDRPYHKGFSTEKVLLELKEGKGVLYEPLIVDTFKNLVNRIDLKYISGYKESNVI